MSSLTPCPLLINGEWLTPKIGSTPVYNPSTGDIIAECPAGDVVGAALRRELSR